MMMIAYRKDVGCYWTGNFWSKDKKLAKKYASRDKLLIDMAGFPVEIEITGA